ncbi:MAG: hypothetical protein K5696_00280 [Lachnospiraceae bacterium]|nr:hypothetical protein [Lachnospiraceae bacterium]
MNKIKLIPPFVMLFATAAVAVITYLRDLPFDVWLVLVLGVMVFFLFIGEVLRQMIEYFCQINEKKLLEEQAAAGSEGGTQDGDQPADKNKAEGVSQVSDLPPVS